MIAEGVENEEQLGFLREHDCDEMQGYHFSRPVGPEALARILHGQPSLTRTERIRPHA